MSIAACTMFAVIATAQVAAESEFPFIGRWRGEIVRDGFAWNAEVHIARSGEGLVVRCSFPDWGMFLLPTDRPMLDGSSLRFTTAWIDSTFEGRLDGRLLEGAWTFGLGAARAVFHRSSADPGLPRTETVTITADDGATLAGTLILPDGEPPHAAMALTHGSGPDTRRTGPYIGKANLAALNGLAVLAWDKRGAGESTGTGAHDIGRLAADARLMIEHLRADPRIDPRRVGIGGISQGAWVAPKVAFEDRDVAFVFVTATPAISPAEQNIFSLRNRFAAGGLDEAAVDDAVAAMRTVYEYYRTGDEGVRERAVSLVESGAPAWAESELFSRFLFTPDGEVAAEMNAGDYATMFVDPLMWWREITVPVVSFSGTDDVNVPTAYSRDLLVASLEHAGNRSFRVLVLDHAGHGLSVEDLPEGDWPRMAPGYVEMMAAWFARRAGRRGP